MYDHWCPSLYECRACREESLLHALHISITLHALHGNTTLLIFRLYFTMMLCVEILKLPLTRQPRVHAARHRHTHTFRWLRWKQDLSHINHKRSELGQDSCRSTEIRSIFWYRAKTERASQKYKNEIRSQRLRFLFKTSEALLLSCADVLPAGVWAASAAADRLSLNSTISVIVCWLYMEPGLLLCRLLAGDGNMLEQNFSTVQKCIIMSSLSTQCICGLISLYSHSVCVCAFRLMRLYKQTFKRFRLWSEVGRSHGALFSSSEQLLHLLGGGALNHQPCEWPTASFLFYVFVFLPSWSS